MHVHEGYTPLHLAVYAGDLEMTQQLLDAKVDVVAREKVCCSAVCCSVLQCVAVCCSVLQCVTCLDDDTRDKACCKVLQCVAVCCSELCVLMMTRAITRAMRYVAV